MSLNIWQEFRQKAARHPRRIVLAEGEDSRVVQAAIALQAEKIVQPWLVGSRKKVAAAWTRQGGKPSDLMCIDPLELTAGEKQACLDAWLALPKNKQQTTAEALQKLNDPLVLGCLYLKRGKMDGFVGGATRSTADTLRVIFSVIGLAPAASTLFGFFLMENRSASPESSGLIMLADCAVIPDPSAKQLSNIAVGAAEAYGFFLQEAARVAFLSFSTAGSAAHPFVDKVREALAKAREKAPSIAFDGEWQADTALDPFTASVKGVAASPMAGRANVLIVPDLNCGNIAYKLAQRLGHIRAVGPVLWGTAQPANDLSRGCSTEDIIDMAALTAIQAQALQPQTAVAEKEPQR